MHQLNPQKIDMIRSAVAADPSILEPYRKHCEIVLQNGIRLPENILATWGHYFVCPADAYRLTYDYTNSESYTCPHCKKVYTGEPYRGGWWRQTLSHIAYTCEFAANIWLFTDERQYFDLARDILMQLADHYKYYELHGDIPYNHQGRLASQTLCEASLIRVFAFGYDLISDTLSEEEKNYICSELFEPSAEVLIGQRFPQIHNHEVMVDAALAVLGALTGRQDYLTAGSTGKYGLLWQLQNGILEDGMWFEESAHYHFYAMLPILEYEKFFEGTEYSFASLPYYRKMLDMPLCLLQPDHRIPTLNDSTRPLFDGLIPYYEYFYRIYGSEDYAAFLNTVYGDRPRNGLEKLKWFSDELPQVKLKNQTSYHNLNGSGITVLRPEPDRYLLFKHGRFGGEHDHYDKLGFHLSFGQNTVIPDKGTTSYAAPVHYGYFKNTFSHNTVCINSENQPPCNGTSSPLIRYSDGLYVCGHASWSEPFPGLNSFTICQWSDEAYRGIQMDRMFFMAKQYIIEAFSVRGGKGRTVDWIIHPKGGITLPDRPVYPVRIGNTAPIGYVTGARGFAPDECTVNISWRTPTSILSLYSACSVPSECVFFESPDNPVSNPPLHSYLRRVNDCDDILFVHVFDLQKDQPAVKSVSIDFRQNEGFTVSVTSDQYHLYSFDADLRRIPEKESGQ